MPLSSQSTIKTHNKAQRPDNKISNLHVPDNKVTHGGHAAVEKFKFIVPIPPTGFDRPPPVRRLIANEPLRG
ncbi:MAG: hypothetical protein EHM48_00845 [Planctomycetaceae bacterium]|nr:MAG: hypothetical protein EHM48_00845 [Planctomycetaceae bacterium]